jgi:RNA recognition motif-containing protein
MQDNANTSPRNNECYSVIVKNLHREADLQKTLSDFFTFCGPIKSIEIIDESPENVSGVIRFENSADIKTAVLLNNTQINDRYITVELYQPGSTQQATEPQGPVDAFLNDAASVVKSVDESIQLSATVGAVAQSIEASATNFNEEYQISQKLTSVGDSIKDTALGLDNTLQISNNASAVGSSIKGSLEKFEEEHQIGQRVAETAAVVSDTVITGVQSGVASVSSGVQTASASVSEFLTTNETAKTGMEFVSDIGDSLTNAVNGLWTALATPQPAVVAETNPK